MDSIGHQSNPLGGARSLDLHTVDTAKSSRLEKIKTGTNLASRITNAGIALKYNLCARVTRLSETILTAASNITKNPELQYKAEVKKHKAMHLEDKSREVYMKVQLGDRFIVPCHNLASRAAYENREDMASAMKLLSPNGPINGQKFDKVDFSKIETGMKEHDDTHGVCYAIAVKFSKNLNAKIGDEIKRQDLETFGQDFMNGGSQDVVAAHKVYSGAQNMCVKVYDDAIKAIEEENPNATDVEKHTGAIQKQTEYLLGKLLSGEDKNVAARDWILSKTKSEDQKKELGALLNQNPERAYKLLEGMVKKGFSQSPSTLGSGDSRRRMVDEARINGGFTNLAFMPLSLFLRDACAPEISERVSQELSGRDGIVYAALGATLTKKTYAPIDPKTNKQDFSILNTLPVGSHVLSIRVGGGENGTNLGGHAICLINAGKDEGYYAMDPNFGVIRLDPSDDAAKGIEKFLTERYQIGVNGYELGFDEMKVDEQPS